VRVDPRVGAFARHCRSVLLIGIDAVSIGGFAIGVCLVLAATGAEASASVGRAGLYSLGLTVSSVLLLRVNGALRRISAGHATAGWPIGAGVPRGFGDRLLTRVVARMAALLPEWARDRYVEEWLDSLYDIHAGAGSAWYRIPVELFQCLRAAAILAVTLRFNERRVAD
jgi:hypothetical protein